VFVDKYFKKFEQELTLKFVTIFLDVVLYEIFCNRILYKPLYVFYVNFTSMMIVQTRNYRISNKPVLLIFQFFYK